MYGTPSAGEGGDDADRRDVAREQGREVADDARAQAQQVTQTARQEGARVTEEVKHHVVDLAEDAKQQLHQQARTQTDNVGGALEQLGSRFHALAEGRSEDAGPVGEYADRLAEQVDTIARRIDELGFDGLVDEAQRFARRRPGAFLAGAALAGFAVARLSRGARDAEQDQHGQPGQQRQQASMQTAPGLGQPSATRPPSGAYAGSPERRATPMPVDTSPVPGAGVPPVGAPSTDPLSSGQVRR
jgi:hypothetical protein